MTRSAVAVLGLRSTVVDAKARTELGYQPVVSLEEWVQEMLGPAPDR